MLSSFFSKKPPPPNPSHHAHHHTHLSRLAALYVYQWRQPRRSPTPTLLVQLPLGAHCPVVLQVSRLLQPAPREGPLVGGGGVKSSSLQQALDVAVSRCTATHHGQPHLGLDTAQGDAHVARVVPAANHAPAPLGYIAWWWGPRIVHRENFAAKHQIKNEYDQGEGVKGEKNNFEL